MRHLHEELLAGLALGEADPLSRRERAHLLICRHCAGRLADLRTIVATGREAKPYPLRETRRGLLAAIQAELGNDEAAQATYVLPAAMEATPVDLTARRRASGLALRHPARLAAAAALVAVTVGGTIWYESASDEVVVASATLQALPSKSGEGTARLVRKHGIPELSVAVTAQPPANAFAELWLINTDNHRMISLGIVPPGGRATYAVPAAAGALEGYTIVDISAEPLDGNAAHSKNSILRGTLH